jgi:hypothetical protein
MIEQKKKILHVIYLFKKKRIYVFDEFRGRNSNKVGRM